MCWTGRAEHSSHLGAQLKGRDGSAHEGLSLLGGWQAEKLVQILHVYFS
jgi:hypothetical protein